MKCSMGIIAVAGSICFASLVPSAAVARQDAVPTTAPAVQAASTSDGTTLYIDATATSAATVTQILPDSKQTQMNLDQVKRVRLQGNVLVVEWGGTAVTLLPRQFVSAITINKRAPAAK